MKIEQALVLYLLKHKQISLQGIGTFTIDAVLPESTDSEKPVLIPPDTISFVYDPKTKEDDKLIDFIVQNTKKIKPLASADLDSFLTLGRQFLNIGKPFNIQNLGTLEKLKSGVLDFKAGPLIQRVEAPKIKIEDEGAEKYEENLFNDYQKSPSNNNGKTFLIVIIIIIASIGAWAAWHYGFKSNSRNIVEVDSNTIVPVKDSADIIKKNDPGIAAQKMADSLREDSLHGSLQNALNNSTFKIVIFQTNDYALASARLAKLQRAGRKVIMYTSDSVTYKVAYPFQLPVVDTLIILDSINKFYRGKAFVETK